jgi:Phage capsid protein
MADQITTAFVQDYKTTVMMLTQQMGSRLRNLVTFDTYTGKAGKAVEQFGATKAVKRTARHADTPLIDVPQNARWVFPVDYEWADLIDDQDKLRMAIDPTSPIAQAGAMAMGRAMDDEILGAFYGTAKTGENGTTNTTFDTTNQIVGPNVGGTSSGLNVAKLREAKRILMANNVDTVAEKISCVITSKEHDSLLNEIQVISTDFNDKPVLVDGLVQRFLGIDFYVMEFSDTTAFDNASAMLNSTNRYVPLFTQKAMHLGLWNDTEAKMSERDDKGYATQVYLRSTVGATRIDEKRIVRIECV